MIFEDYYHEWLEKVQPAYEKLWKLIQEILCVPEWLPVVIEESKDGIIK